MYGLTAEDQRIRDTAYEFAESLIPYEVEAELAGGQLPKELTAEFHDAGHRIGAVRHQHAEVGRRAGLHRAAAGSGAGAGRPGDQRTGLGDAHAAAVVGRRRHRLSARALAAARGARREARGVRHHRGVRRLRCVRPDRHRPPGRRRVRAQRRQVARHLVQPGRVRLRAGRARSAANSPATTCLLVVDLPWPGVEVVRTPHYSHNIADEHPIVSFTDVRVPVVAPGRRRGRGHDVHPGLVPLRTADGGGPLRRCRHNASSTR